MGLKLIFNLIKSLIRIIENDGEDISILLTKEENPALPLSNNGKIIFNSISSDEENKFYLPFNSLNALEVKVKILELLNKAINCNCTSLSINFDCSSDQIVNEAFRNSLVIKDNDDIIAITGGLNPSIKVEFNKTINGFKVFELIAFNHSNFGKYLYREINQYLNS